MQIFVKFSDRGVTCTVDIEPTTTVGEIKARAAAKLEATNGMGVAPAQIRLRWNSRQLDEGVGHASAETTARYVHLSSETLAAEFAAARAATGR